MYKSFIKKNSISAAIVIFLAIFILFIYIKPNFLFNKRGVLRVFGLGKRNSTILPIWLLVIITGIIFILICSLLSTVNFL